MPGRRARPAGWSPLARTRTGCITFEPHPFRRAARLQTIVTPNNPRRGSAASAVRPRAVVAAARDPSATRRRAAAARANVWADRGCRSLMRRDPAMHPPAAQPRSTTPLRRTAPSARAAELQARGTRIQRARPRIDGERAGCQWNGPRNESHGAEDAATASSTQVPMPAPCETCRRTWMRRRLGGGERC
jgi:hypothetical protein